MLCTWKPEINQWLENISLKLESHFNGDQYFAGEKAQNIWESIGNIVIDDDK